MLPASAGMILAVGLWIIRVYRAPRIRGDDPPGSDRFQDRTECSPHPRG